MTLRKVSARRARENRTRAKVLKIVSERQDYRCARCGSSAPLDGHEILRRSQCRSAITNPDLIVGLCRNCHEWVTANPQAAHDTGWSIWSWEYGKDQEQ